jgi:hypothetical protein
MSRAPRRPSAAVRSAIALVTILAVTGLVSTLLPAPAATPVARRAGPEPPPAPAPEPVPEAAPEPAPAPVPVEQPIFIDNFTGPAGGPIAPWWSHRADPWGNSSSDAVARLAGGGILDVLPGGLIGTNGGNPAGTGFVVPYEEGRTYRAEARLKMPTTQGNHASFWLRTPYPDAWGELDVVESWNQFDCPTNISFYWLYDEDPTDNRVQSCIASAVPDPSAWHTYAVEFTYAGAVPPNTPASEPTATRYYVDGTLVATVPLSPVRGSDPATPASQFLNLQNKVNGPGTPISEGDARMQVDWVKVSALGAPLLPPVVSPLESDPATTAAPVDGPTDLPYVLAFEVSNAEGSSVTCTLDGTPFACPDPTLVTLGVLPYGAHTFRLDVANAAGTGSWETTWTGGQAPPA